MLQMPKLVQIPVWRDNYAYLVVAGTRAFVVDSPEAGPVLERLRDFPGVGLEAVVNTHHHPDHVGSNRDLIAATGCAVVGPAHDAERIPGITREAEVGTTIEVAGLALRVLDVHGHTAGHVAYAYDRGFDEVIRHGHQGQPAAIPRLADRPALFVGDSLFLGGCGRLFEGSAEDLVAAMTVLRAEDPQALICCAHEYTESNLRFAAHLLPEHRDIAQRLEALPAERRQTGSSVPDVLSLELRTNPFMLGLDDVVRPRLATSLGVIDEPVAVLGAARRAKDAF